MTLGVDLCITYSIELQEFVEELFAFTVNTSTGMECTETTLDDFERKELTNHKSNIHGMKNNVSKTQQNVNYHYDEIESDGENDEVMDAYICTTPKVV